MNEVDMVGTAITSGKVSAFFYLVKKYAAFIIPTACIAAACIIVMAMTRPKSNREFIVAITATIAGAYFGPSVVILLCGIDFSAISAIDQDKARSLLTIVCGLPGWVIVRACFNWSEINKTKTIVELVGQLKALWK